MSLFVVLICFSTVNQGAPLSLVLKHTAVTVFRAAEIRYVVFILIRFGFINKFGTFLFCSFPSIPLSLEAGTAASLEESARFLSFHELSELMQALPGFLMLLTGEGKLLYLSDSVSEHLGHSMVGLHRISVVLASVKTHSSSTLGFINNISVCMGFFFQVDLVAQGDSVYDIVDASDHFVMRTNLSTSTSLEIGKKKMLISQIRFFLQLP